MRRRVIDKLLNQIDGLKARKAALEGSSLSDDIYDLLEEDWQWQLKDNPEYATQAGQHQYDGTLQDLSPAAFEARAAHDRQVLVKAEQLLASAIAAAPDGASTLHLKLFVQDLHDELHAWQH